MIEENTRKEYTLIFYVDGKEVHESDFMTLQQIDENTVEYKSQKELALAKQQELGIDSRGRKVEVRIGHYSNKQQPRRDTDTSILYQDDRDFIDDRDQYKTLYADLYVRGNKGEKAFVLSTMQRYIDRVRFKSNVLEINNGYDILGNLIEIDERLSSYRSCRNKYLFYWEYKTGESRYNYDGTFKKPLIIPELDKEQMSYGSIDESYLSDLSDRLSNAPIEEKRKIRDKIVSDTYLSDLLDRLDSVSPEERGEIREQIANLYGGDYLDSHNISAFDGTGHGSKK